ncbi:hypothetical protein TELCIR_14665 [Teladorsagia circumcincta]|uniref:NAD(+) kinase n=1 Tax=Teladorsagia circumcincta TaxID=45464 RepID=A0A2G9U0N9_TELCI|nr:hypothetical protein TELCIR_14665 [Teladorsagia circumcincta]
MGEAHILTQLVTRQSLPLAVPWADLVVSAGGDGTFLTAAAAVTDKTPVIGINTDPVGYYGMNRVEEQCVATILEAAQGMGVEVKANVRELASEIARKLNDKIAFEPSHPNFAYSIREPIFNATFKRTPVRGFARRIRLKSKCSKGFLVLDGATKIPFNSGTEVLLEINEADSLRTITL